MLISTTIVLSILFTPLSLIILANAYLVPNTRTMRISVGVAGVGVFLLSLYWILRSLGIVEVNQPLPTLFVSFFFILFVIGLYSVFGVPLLDEAFKRREYGKK